MAVKFTPLEIRHRRRLWVAFGNLFLRGFTAISVILFLLISYDILSAQEQKNNLNPGKQLKNVLVKKEAPQQKCKRIVKEPIKARELKYMESASADIKAGRYDAAIKSYKALLKISPRNAEAHYYLGLVYKYYYNDKKKALFHFKKCLKRDPEFKNKSDIKYLIKMGEQNEW